MIQIIAVLVASCAVSRKIEARDLGPVRLFVSLVVAPDRPQHRRPRMRRDEIAALVRADRLRLLW